MFSTLNNVKISALRTSVPAEEICLTDELEYYDNNRKKVQRIQNTLGMDRRRVCPKGVTASDLCAHAAENLFTSSPHIREKIDVLVFLSQSPDWHQPATACELQHRLGLSKECAAFDVNQGCTGYIYGLWLASSFIASGSANAVLLLVGDANPVRNDPRNRIIAPVFGDAGSATLLERDPTAKPLYFGFGTDGSGFESIIVPAGKARIPLSTDCRENDILVEEIRDPHGNVWRLMNIFMDGGAIYNFTIDVVPDHIRKFLEYAQCPLDEVQHAVLHQANRQIVTTIAQKVGIPPAKVPTESFSKYGNTACASIPLALCDAFGAGTAPGTSLLCGYGIGLAWGSCLCHLVQWDCAPPSDFHADPARPTRQQRIERWIRIMGGNHD